MIETLRKIYQEAEGERQGKIMTIGLGISQDLDINYDIFQLPDSTIDDAIHEKGKGSVVNIDRETIALISIKNKIDSKPDSKVILLGLQINPTQCLSVWLCDTSESRFCSIVKELIEDRYPDIVVVE